MSNYTTVEADPKGAVSFLRALKQKTEMRFRPDQYETDWFTRTSKEVQERLGRSSLWDNPSPVGIGLDYELLAGVNIGGTHPVIDDVNVTEGIVTSMKTMDTHKFSYSDTNGILRKAKEYVDKFEQLAGVKTLDGFELPLGQVKRFHLEIAVRTDMTLEQKNAFLKVQEYGQKEGVRVIIAEVA